jgi:hypothetical protein
MAAAPQNIVAVAVAVNLNRPEARLWLTRLSVQKLPVHCCREAIGVDSDIKEANLVRLGASRGKFAEFRKCSRKTGTVRTFLVQVSAVQQALRAVTTVTLVEDLGMAPMAAAMLAMDAM